MKRIILAIICLTILTTGVITAVMLRTADNELTQNNQSTAASFALQYAKNRCTEDDLSSDVCNSLTASATTTDCSDGYVCWIAHVKAREPKMYDASMYVKRVNPQEDQSLKSLSVNDFEQYAQN